MWKDIRGFEGLYKISDNGEVKSLPKYNFSKNKILKADKTSAYFRVILFKDNVKKRYSIHRIVATEFIKNIKNLPQVNHIDGDKRNNNVKNLEWVSRKENIRKAWRLGLMENIRKASRINGRKLAEGKYYITKSISQYDKSNNFVKKFKSISEASRELKINLGNIASNCRQERKTAGGFIFKFNQVNKKV